MRLATWNVNSIQARLDHVVTWLGEHQPDVLCLQEIKTVEVRFPYAVFAALGYEAAVFGQPGYNGVATLSRRPGEDIEHGFPDERDQPPARLLAGTFDGVRVVNVYVPNGAPLGSERFTGKLVWLDRLRRYLTAFGTAAPLVLCGDFNVAPEERDVYDPVLLSNMVLFTPEERAALAPVAACGLVDCFRQHHAEPGLYSWWDYRAGAFRRNLGLRIDHIWASAPLAARCTAAWIDRGPRGWERPSDHVPVVADFAPA